MTAGTLLEKWRIRCGDGAGLSAIDEMVFDVVRDARSRGISRAELDNAAGGSVRKYLTKAIMSDARGLDNAKAGDNDEDDP